MTKKRFERIYADVDVFCRDHDAKGLSQLIEKEDYDAIVDLLNSLSEENEQLKEQLIDCEKFRHTVYQEISKEMNKHD